MESLPLSRWARKNALFAQYGPDLVRTMQQRGLNWRRVEKRARRQYKFHHVARTIEQRMSFDRELLLDSTWRDVTSRLWEQHMWLARSLARVAHDNISRLMIATRQRLTMQRFVRGLRRRLS